MKINNDLNLIIPVEREEGTIYVHAKPIGWDVFELYHRTLGAAYEALTSDGLNLVVCLATARIALKDAAVTLDRWDGADGVKNGFLGELQRTAMVHFPTEKGWEDLMLVDAVRRGIIDEDEQREVENALVFFTLCYRMFTKDRRAKMLNAMALVGGYQLSSSNDTEFKDSLLTLTTEESTKEAGSLIPS